MVARTRLNLTLYVQTDILVQNYENKFVHPPHPFTLAKFNSAFYHLPKRLFRLADTVA
jgi:hypothetical protein